MAQYTQEEQTYLNTLANILQLATKVGITSININLTTAVTLPSGTTAERPTTVADGMLRFNSSTNRIEAYYSGGWNNL
jgi:hypothetical protein